MSQVNSLGCLCNNANLVKRKTNEILPKTYVSVQRQKKPDFVYIIVKAFLRQSLITFWEQIFDL